ncbi:MAG TPA: hypothetical protein VHV32_19315 [Candidatus Angelobacter sp.]|nr:hypothetical protein [Candidatus Angelobacter sp.]
MPEDRITAALRGKPSWNNSDIGKGASTIYERGKDQEPGDGTAQAGYVTPDLGPFECENCIHFDGQSQCNHPTVQGDPEVQGNVEPEGCCNFFKSDHNETQAEEHGEQEQ